MTYANTQHLIQRYSERDICLITDPNGQQVDKKRAIEALQDASDEMDSYLGQRFILPLQTLDGESFDTPPSALVRCCCDIAVYRLQTLRPSDDVQDARKRYEDVLRLLKSLVNGDVILPNARIRAEAMRADALASPTSVGMPEFGHPASLFGRGNR